MRNSILIALVSSMFGLPAAVGQEGPVTPLTLPKSIRVQSAGPRGQVWATLSPKEKELTYWLTQAAIAGRDLLFQRSHRHALTIKHVLEEALSAQNLKETKTLLGD